MSEYRLRGGSVNSLVRAGDTVRRGSGGRFVHELLGFFEQSGWGGAPRFLGVDERGREILSFVDGYVPWRSAGVPGVAAEASLVRVAELVREFHDLTAGTPLAGDAEAVMVRLRDDGAVREVRAAFGWVAESRAELEGS